MRSVIVPCLIALCLLAACKPGEKDNQVSASGARQVEPYHVPRNSQGNSVEQQNIYDRQRVTTDPTKVMWIHLVGLDGKIISRMPVRNKATSSSKRLEPKKVVIDPRESSGHYPSYNGYYVDELIQPDGTYGDSDPYIYWFDPQGRYHQWGTAGGLGYLLTDYPIDLVKPQDEITGLYNANKAASEWQAAEEAKLRAAESGAKPGPAEAGGVR